MNSKVNFHGQEIDLEQVVSAISVNKKLSDARNEVHRLQRIKDDYR